jgi:hypothetical protein
LKSATPPSLQQECQQAPVLCLTGTY